VLMIITGITVNGPYAMITTAVSADLVRLIILCIFSVKSMHIMLRSNGIFVAVH